MSDINWDEKSRPLAHQMNGKHSNRYLGSELLSDIYFREMTMLRRHCWREPCHGETTRPMVGRLEMQEIKNLEDITVEIGQISSCFATFTP